MSLNVFAGRTILVTGGTGSFGQHFVRTLLTRWDPRSVRIYSRDELKQHDMSRRISDDRLRFLLGDVRDPERLIRAFDGVDVVVHCAALKQVPACEYNPFEAIKTNVLGTQNVAAACLDAGVARAVALSTDKAVSPANLYGATKLCAEKLFIQANVYAGARPTRLSCVRYGNVIGSRGSVVPVFSEQIAQGHLTVTDQRMTRFWISLDQAVEFVARSLERMKGGEVFIPKLPSMKVMDLVDAMAPGIAVAFTGVRPGEKLHESLITAEEARHAVDRGDHYVVEPEHPFWKSDDDGRGQRLPEGFSYSSDANDQWLSVDDLRVSLASAGVPVPPPVAATARP